MNQIVQIGEMKLRNVFSQTFRVFVQLFAHHTFKWSGVRSVYVFFVGAQVISTRKFLQTLFALVAVLKNCCGTTFWFGGCAGTWRWKKTNVCLLIFQSKTQEFHFKITLFEGCANCYPLDISVVPIEIILRINLFWGESTGTKYVYWTLDKKPEMK